MAQSKNSAHVLPAVDFDAISKFGDERELAKVFQAFEIVMLMKI